MRRNHASIFNENVTHYGRAATPHGKKTDIVIFAPTREITLFSTGTKPKAPQTETSRWADLTYQPKNFVFRKD